MGIIVPTDRSEITERLQTDFISNIPESDPFVRESWTRAVLIAVAGREFDIYTQVNQLLLDLFPTTATGTFARQWGNLKGVDIEAAKSAEGFISVIGTPATSVPQGTLWQNGAGLQYTSLQDYTINTRTIQVDLISSGGIADAETLSAHNLATGMQVTISGADQSEYNGTFTIIVTSETSFRYAITGSPASPATGTIIASADFVSVFVQATDTGQETNLDSGAQLTLTTPIGGVDNTSFVQFTEVSGGADTETAEEYRLRYLERYQQQTAHFNAADIIRKAEEIPGTTNVEVFRVTPQVGDVTVYFLRYNDLDPIPTPQEISDMIENLKEITPANTPVLLTNDAGLIVKAPTVRLIDFSFSQLTPNTQTMKDSVTASLEQFFRDEVFVGVKIPTESYRNAIIQTVDDATNSKVESFTLTQPTGDIDINAGERGFLGDITFA